MIRKSGNRFSEKIMLKQKDRTTFHFRETIRGQDIFPAPFAWCRFRLVWRRNSGRKHFARGIIPHAALRNVADFIVAISFPLEPRSDTT
jgi:hypothetical protein